MTPASSQAFLSLSIVRVSDSDIHKIIKHFQNHLYYTTFLALWK